MADFTSWSRETLEDFARTATAQLKYQKDVIEHLERDLKDALKACRELMRKDVSQPGQ